MFWTPTRLNHPSPTVQEAPASAPTASDRVDFLHLETAFRQWVAGRARPELLLLDPDGGLVASVSMEDALLRLRTSSRRLHPALADRLGLPDDATVGAAAIALLQARLDPQGPRCRSFRSAALYLVGLAELRPDAHGAQPLAGAVDVA